MCIVKVHSLELTQMETISLEVVLSISCFIDKFLKSIMYIKYTFCMFKKSMFAIYWLLWICETFKLTIISSVCGSALCLYMCIRFIKSSFNQQKSVFKLKKISRTLSIMIILRVFFGKFISILCYFSWSRRNISGSLKDREIDPNSLP